MKRECEYTEKQLRDRGRIFEISFFLAVILTLCMDMLNGSFGITIGIHTASIISFWCSITICYILLIAKNYFGKPKDTSTNVLFVVWSVLGVMFLLMDIGDIHEGRFLVAQEGGLSETALHIFYSSCLLIIAIVYWGKYLYNKKRRKQWSMNYKKEILLKDGTAGILRNATSADAKAILVHIKKTSSETDYMLRYPEEITLTEDQEQGYLQSIEDSNRALMIAAMVENQIVAIASMTPIAKTEKCRHRAELGISVLKKYWGMGIGTELIKALLEMAEKAGYEQLELEVTADNERAIALYHKFGFETYGTRKHSFKCRDGKYKDLNLMMYEIEKEKEIKGEN